MKVFLDTNVFVDMLLSRPNPADNENALLLLKLATMSKFEFCVSPVTIATSYYLLRKNTDAVNIIKQRLKNLTLVQTSADDVVFSLTFNFPDREDAMQISSAWNADCEVILTRNTDHFINSPIPFLTPSEFLERVSKYGV